LKLKNFFLCVLCDSVAKKIKMKLDLQKINKELEDKTAFDIIKWAYQTFEHDFIKLSTR